MSLIKAFLGLLILILGIGASASAQEITDVLRSGSIYSNFGLGEPQNYHDPVSEGMGLTGVAYFDPNVASTANPAYWGRALFTRGSATLKFENFTAANQTATSTNSLLSTGHFQFIFPIIKNELGMSLSLSPVTRSNFRVADESIVNLANLGIEEPVGVEILNRGDGGVSRLELGFGYSISPKLSLGYAGSLLFGSFTNSFDVIYDNNVLNNTQFDQHTNVIGFGNRFGLFGSIQDINRNEGYISYGLSAHLPVQLGGKREITSPVISIISGRQTVETLTIQSKDSLGDAAFRLPLKLSGGLTYAPNRSLRIGGDVVVERWSDYRNFFGNPEQLQVNGSSQNIMKNRIRTGLGVSYYPHLNRKSGFFSKFKYRAGITYDTGYLEIEDRDIQTLYLNAGFSFLSRKNRSSIDFNIHYGIRGTRSDALIREDILGMRLTFNLSELMFIQRKFQ